MSTTVRHLFSLGILCLAVGAVGCGGGQGGLQLQAPCLVISETDEQAFLQIGGAFDQLRHDEGVDPPIKMTKKIDRFIKAQMCSQELAGLGLGIVWQGNLVYIKGYGLARGYETAGGGDDVSVRGQRTRFRWASLSKSVTGLCSMIATQDPAVNYDLDANLASNYRCANQSCDYVLPIQYYDSWSPNVDDGDWPLPRSFLNTSDPTHDFTPRRLLANRCGVMHYGDGDPNTSSGKPGNADKANNPGFAWAVNYWTPKPLLYEPTSTYWYSSFGFNMAGAALEHAVPSSFWAYVQANVVDKTALSPMIYLHPDDTNDPQYGMAPWNTTQHRAHGYDKNDADQVVVNTTPGDVSYKLPSGGFISTTADLALYAHGLLNNLFLDPADTDALWTPQANIVQGLMGTPATGYALGFIIAQQSGERLVWHNGGQQDTATQMNLFPDGEDPTVGKLGLVLMTNSEYANRGVILNGVEALLRNPYRNPGKEILFEGTEPQNTVFAAEDDLTRNASDDGPYVDDGRYVDPAEDRYGPAILQIISHRYDPSYLWAPPVPSRELARPDDSEVETPRDVLEP